MAATPILSITNLKVEVESKPILQGLTLDVADGEIHAIMGPNGSGKSTLAYTLAGHPRYQVVSGSIAWKSDGQMINLIELSPDERARQGLFLAFQYPVEVAGVKVRQFLRIAHKARFATQKDKQFDSVLAFRDHLTKLCQDLQIDTSLLNRGLNEGFSGGEKKRLEILQLAVLEPRLAILDETDSGLDVDALKVVARGVRLLSERFGMAVVVITHYQRILDHLTPDKVHVVSKGKIVKTGDASLAHQLEKRGYSNGG